MINKQILSPLCLILVILTGNSTINSMLQKKPTPIDPAHYRYALTHQLGCSSNDLQGLDFSSCDEEMDERGVSEKIKRAKERVKEQAQKVIVTSSPPRCDRTHSPDESDDDEKRSLIEREGFIAQAEERRIFLEAEAEKLAKLTSSLKITDRARSSAPVQPPVSRSTVQATPSITVTKNDGCWQSYPFQLSFDPEHPEAITLSTLSDESWGTCLSNLFTCCFPCCSPAKPNSTLILTNLLAAYKTEYNVKSVTLDASDTSGRWLTKDEIRIVLRYFNNLEKIEFLDVFRINVPIILLLQETSPQLKVLSIIGLTQLHPSSIRGLGKVFKHLTSLNLNNFRGLTDEQDYRYDKFDNDDLNVLVSWAGNLTHLNIGKCDQLTREGITEILCRYNNISSIVIPRCRRLNEKDSLSRLIEEVYKVNRMKNIKVIDVSEHYYLDEDDIIFIATKGHSLETIKLPIHFKNRSSELGRKIEDARETSRLRYVTKNLTILF